MLTDFKIKNLKSRDKKYKVADARQLYLIVNPSGSKVWKFGYKFGSKNRELTIGRYPEVSLASAREHQSDALKLLREHKDPSAQKRHEKLLAVYRDKNSFASVAEEWFGHSQSNWGKVQTAKQRGRLDNHLYPTLAKRPISEIEPLEILSVIQKSETRGATHTAHMLLQICSSIFRLAVRTGRTQTNPADSLRGALKSHKAKHLPSIRSDELPDFFRSLRKLQAHRQYEIAVLLLLQTALRTGELRHAEWHEIDFQNQIWRVPSEKMKMKIEHEVPLSVQSLDLLNELKGITGHQQWLFQNRIPRKHPMMSENAINSILARMGYKGRLVGHGFRSMFSTILNEESPFSSDAIERQLAHLEGNKVRAAYNRAQYMIERTKMMQWWSDYLEEKARL